MEDMAHFQSYDLEFIVEDNDFNGYDDILFEDNEAEINVVDESLGSDFEDDFEIEHMAKPKTDTSAAEVRNGKDIQGIPWERLNFTRGKYRETRLKQYKNYKNLCSCLKELEKECEAVEKSHDFYNFQFNTRLVKSTIVHFQLRNLVWATSKHDVYLLQHYSLMHWSSLLRRSKEVINFAKSIVPRVVLPGSSAESLSRVQISATAIKDNLLAAGGFHGELICKYLNQPGIAFSTKIATGENAIINSIDICHSLDGLVKIMTSNNDAEVRVYDAANFTSLNHFFFPWSVNNTSVSPDGKLLAVLGDSPECLVADAQSGKAIGNLKGHLDYSFASAWHPNGQILATGNQDSTCRLWDVRNLSKSLSVLKGHMGAIRALRFTADGRFMAMAEPADFVHIFDANSNYTTAQEIDLFGEIAGISFSPDTEALFVGVADRTYGSFQQEALQSLLGLDGLEGCTPCGIVRIVDCKMC